MGRTMAINDKRIRDLIHVQLACIKDNICSACLNDPAYREHYLELATESAAVVLDLITEFQAIRSTPPPIKNPAADTTPAAGEGGGIAFTSPAEDRGGP